jgi:hypothetical protein
LSLPKREALIVYAIRSLREVDEMIVGPDLMRTFVLREVARTVHR